MKTNIKKFFTLSLGTVLLANTVTVQAQQTFFTEDKINRESSYFSSLKNKLTKDKYDLFMDALMAKNNNKVSDLINNTNSMEFMRSFSKKSPSPNVLVFALRRNASQKNIAKFVRKTAKCGISSLLKELFKDDDIKNTFCSCDDGFHAALAVQDAAKNGHLDVIQYLFNNHPEIKNTLISHNNGRVAAMTVLCAVEKRHLDVVQKLLTHDDIKNKLISYGNGEYTAWAVQDAASNGYLDVIQYLFNNHPEIKNTLISYNKGEYAAWAVIEAAIKGHLSVVQELLKYKEIKNKFISYRNGKYAADAVKEAAINGHSAVVQYLIENIAYTMATTTEIKAILQNELDKIEQMTRGDDYGIINTRITE